MGALARTHTNRFVIARNTILFAPQNDDGSFQSLRPISPASAGALEVTSENINYVSQESGIGRILAEDSISTTYSGEITTEQMSRELIAAYMQGRLGTRTQVASAVTGELSGFVFPDTSAQLGLGQSTPRPVHGCSAVTVVAGGLTGTIPSRANTTAYALGAVYQPATPNSRWYMCTVAGTSAGTPPTFTTDGTTFTDGTATFRDMGLISYTVDVDYEVDTALGLVHVLSTGAIATAISRVPASLRAQGRTFQLALGYTPEAKTIDEIVLDRQTSLRGKLICVAQNPRGENFDLFCPLVSLSPSGTYAFKSGNEYQNMTFALTVESGSGAPVFTPRAAG
jgi:hypothetical protein